MTFKDADSVQQAVQSMRLAGIPAATNRARINAVMNGETPWTESELASNRGFTNVNFLEGANLITNARRHLHNAHIKPGNLFTCKTDVGPVGKRQEWAQHVTQGINKRLRKDRSTGDLRECLDALTVLHGIAPCQWTDNNRVVPVPLGVDDVLVPARTLCSMQNLEFFGIYREWTLSELWAMSHAPQADAGWNQPLCKSLIAWLREQDLQSQVAGMRWMMPEKIEEDLKENSGWYASNVAPTICVYDFFFLDDRGDEPVWQRRIVLDTYQSQNGSDVTNRYGDDAKKEFLYDSSKRGAVGEPDWHRIIHWQFGNCSNISPFRYGSVRSMGYQLFGPAQLQNIIRCRLTDSTLESMLNYFRNVGEDDRERLEKVDLSHMGIVPDGLSFVTRAERLEINAELVSLGLTQNRQLMQDSSSSWTSSMETGSRTPRTATEEMIKAQTSAALLSTVLNQSYTQSTFMYGEMFRRFCIKDSRDPMVKSFQAEMQMRGVPLQILNSEFWDVEAERVLGGGNKTMEVLQADRLMQLRPDLDPDAQRIVNRKFVIANTDDADLAMQLVPEGPKAISDGSVVANAGFGVLMQGIPFQAPRGISEIDYVETMLQLLSVACQQVLGLDGHPETQLSKVLGVVTAAQNTEQHIGVMEQNPAEKQRVMAYKQMLAQLLDSIRPAIDKLNAGEEQKDDGVSAEDKAKIESMLIQSKAKADIKTSDAALKQQHRDAAFQADLERRNASTASQIQLDAIKTRADIAAKDAETAAKLNRSE